ncbi:hypothetical protein Cob_v000331 [Colletotrichum orbiculare MAFF 240422]|uniref:Uncharacterized protein n=1 Tax=Colletotrichum orbiculare (strain 104-T / ATCC 96160 / CBS 514.97 / LARS 414 / MAFF 240422) TaxID=1213857 RepID=A0A484G8T7_COLOR|nr:hypothetical protein Cob_v000331 [Colletotrichum orbiculare MAFF 240422]
MSLLPSPHHEADTRHHARRDSERHSNDKHDMDSRQSQDSLLLKPGDGLSSWSLDEQAAVPEETRTSRVVICGFYNTFLLFNTTQGTRRIN